MPDFECQVKNCNFEKIKIYPSYYTKPIYEKDVLTGRNIYPSSLIRAKATYYEKNKEYIKIYNKNYRNSKKIEKNIFNSATIEDLIIINDVYKK
jgi:hypothetical protein